MKKYQKPSLEIVKFEMNEAIASCDNALVNNSTLETCEKTDLGEWYESLNINFTGDNGCTVPTHDYCYYTSTSEGATGILASS